jgi:L-proline amide hydrolase
MALWKKSTGQLLNALPADVREKIEKHEKEGTTDSPEYQQMMGIFFEKHVCKTPWPKVMETSFAAMMQNHTVYHTM